MLRLQTDKLAAVAEHDYRCEWQFPEQCSPELCSRSRFANDKRACGTHIHDIIVAQLSCEDAGAKRPVPANIDTPEENHESHTGIKKRRARYATRCSVDRGSTKHEILGRNGVQGVAGVPLRPERHPAVTAYNRRGYARSFVDQAGTVARADRRWTYSASFIRELAGPVWEVGLAYAFEDNRSNDAYAVYRARRVEATVRRRW